MIKAPANPTIRSSNRANAPLQFCSHKQKCEPHSSPSHKWAIYERYLPHVLHLHAAYIDSVPHIKPNAEFAELLCDAGYYMWDRNLGWEGIRILETVDKICLMEEKQHLRRLRANIGVAIGSLLNTIGISRLPQALQLFDTILALRQEHNAELPQPHSQEDQLLLSNAWNDKGWMCMESEDYLAAEGCFEKSIAIKKQWSDKDIPFEIAETTKNISLVRMAQKRSKDAFNLVSYALELIESDPEYGLESATTQKFRLYKAAVLANSGCISEAIDLANEVASARSTLYRPYHPFNLDIYYFQGILSYYSGRGSEAEKFLRQTLHEDVQNPYPDECKARCFYALSEVLRDNGKEDESEIYRNKSFLLLDQFRDFFMLSAETVTHDSVLFDHAVPLKCTRLSKHGKLWVGEKR